MHKSEITSVTLILKFISLCNDSTRTILSTRTFYFYFKFTSRPQRRSAARCLCICVSHLRTLRATVTSSHHMSHKCIIYYLRYINRLLCAFLRLVRYRILSGHFVSSVSVCERKWLTRGCTCFCVHCCGWSAGESMRSSNIHVGCVENQHRASFCSSSSLSHSIFSSTVPVVVVVRLMIKSLNQSRSPACAPRS